VNYIKQYTIYLSITSVYNINITDSTNKFSSSNEQTRTLLNRLFITKVYRANQIIGIMLEANQLTPMSILNT